MNVRVLGRTLAVAVVLFAAPATASTTGLDSRQAPALAGVNTFLSVGPTALAVYAPKPFVVEPGRDGIALSYRRWAAFILVRQSAGESPPHHPYTLGHVEQPPPSGCASTPAHRCFDRRGLVMYSYLPEAVVNGGGFVGASPHAVLRYPAGRYVAYLLTDAHSPMRVTWRLSGAGQAARFVGQRGVAVTQFADSVHPGGSVADVSGTRAQRLRHPGAVIERTWTANVPGSQAEADTQHVCVYDARNPRGESIDPHACWVNPLATPVNRRPDATGGLLVGSSTQGFSGSGFDDSSVAPGTYSVKYSASCVSDHPAAGVFLLSWEYLR